MAITAGYELREVRTWDGGKAFAAVLHREGRELGHVYNAGGAGGTVLHLDPAEERAFQQAATTAFGDHLGAREELVRHLLDVDALNRRRARVVLVDDMDFFTDRRSLSMPSLVPADTIASLLTTQGRTNIRVWDRQATQFVPMAA